MPRADALRWDERYRTERYAASNQPRPLLVECSAYLPPRGLALDVAMGLGGNAAFLMERGLRVVGVDISSVAVRSAKQRLPDLMAVTADLTCFYLPVASFDVIINFYYLQRDLWPAYRQALRPSGVLIMETLTQEMLALQPDVEPEYLLSPGELKEAFSDWEVLVYREGWGDSSTGHPRAIASLAARKPA
jgi:tellurite methyltransferase